MTRGHPRPGPATCEPTLTALHPGVATEEARAATGWDLAVAADVETTEAPSTTELELIADPLGEMYGTAVL